MRRTDAHDARDGVGAMCAPRREPGKIFTASSAGRIRLWDVASFTGLGNRALTGPSAGASFIAELGELESEDCEWISACCDDRGSLALVGADEGLVAAWDPRRKRASWIAEACPSGRDVTGLALMPDGFRVAVACGDGFARILELRKCGEVSDDRDLGVGSLTCVLANGSRGLLCGGRTGSLAAWDPDLAAPAAVRKPFRVRGVEVPSRGVGSRARRRRRAGARSRLDGTTAPSACTPRIDERRVWRVLQSGIQSRTVRAQSLESTR